jgi:mRNA-degrading endonuclease RelE of RelBE toxin-antitoxin system
MEFRIADTFTDSLARLTGDEQKAVKTTAFDLQMNPAAPGMQFHKLARSRDKNFSSVRVSSDIRLIVHRSEDSLLLCYVGHHDDAYQWAERRKVETHPRTGAAQLVEIQEIVREIAVPKFVDAPALVPTIAAPKAPLFSQTSDEDLLLFGVPPEWLGEVRRATEDSILELAEHLPAEAAEALLEAATGGVVREPVASYRPSDPFQHPDAQRRFRTVDSLEELERALEYPWDKWTVFLHPAQRDAVERDYSGPARISGTAGTGKTIVALHRAAFLARTNPECRVLLTTFSEALANALRMNLRRLIGNEPRLGERLEVHAIDAVARRLYELNIGRPRLASPEAVRRFLDSAARDVGAGKFSSHFLATEWEEVVDAWQLDSWEAYRDVARLGRKTRLPEKQRQTLWGVFERVRQALDTEGLVTGAGLFSALAGHLCAARHPPFDFVVVDEAQDVSVAQLRFLAALGGARPNGMFFTGDLGQRIFQQPFSWKALGVEIRGRSKTLRINYRTSHQIRAQADRLLGPYVTDVDGNVEDRRGTVSVFNGPPPVIVTFDTQQAEIAEVGRWLAERAAEGVKAHEIGVFVRAAAQLDRARPAMADARIPFKILDEHMDQAGGHAAVGTMHFAKGLEFRAVVVMSCDDEIIPLQERIESVVDDMDLEDVYNTERHLLYVACTRARDHLLVTGVRPASEFLDDLSS